MSIFLKRVSIVDPKVKAIIRGILFCILAAIGAYIITSLNISENQEDYLVDTIRIGAAFFIFLNTWITFDENPQSNNIIGLGFLVVVILASFHVSLQDDRSSILLDMITDLTEGLIIFVATNWGTDNKLNKSKSLIIACLITFLIISLVLGFHSSPIIGFVIKFKIIKYFIIVLCLITLEKSLAKLKHNSLITYEYIATSSLLLIFGTVFTANFNGFSHSFVHLLKVFNYYCLMRGIYVSSILYPYKITKSILNQIPLGLFVYNNNGKLTSVNEYGKKLVVGELNDIRTLKPEKFEKHTIDNNPNLQSLLYRIESYHEIHNELFYVDNQQQKQYFLVDALNLGDSKNLVILRDTEREQQLENIQLQTSSLLNAINNPLVINDASDKIILFNEAFLHLIQLPASDILGYNINSINKHVQLKSENELADEFANDHKNISMNNGKVFSLITPGGWKKYIIGQPASVKNLQGEIIGGLSVYYEITEMKNNQARIRQQDKMITLGEMAAGIVHEIRNPLTTLKGFSELILHKTEKDQIKQFAQLMIDTANDVNKIVSDFLTFAKPSPPSFKLLDANNLLQSVVSMLDCHAYMQRTNLKVIPCTNQLQFQGDESQLKAVILNIALNGMEAMSDLLNPVLTLACEFDKTSNTLIFKVSDNGKGIPPDDQVKLGTPFFTTKDKGTGLGLSISYQIIREHMGRIDVQSSVGFGTTFEIRIPLSKNNTKFAVA
ncbi:MAG: ATP-binding protein [Desulfitobacteriaceae bacterium]